MKELSSIFEAYTRATPELKKALATVIKVEGSSYRRPGARMLMFDNGTWIGAISGGCLEGDALRRSREVIRSGEPRVIVYDTRDDQKAESLGIGLGCNGVIHILLEPITEEKNPMDLLEGILSGDTPAAVASVFTKKEDETIFHGRMVRSQQFNWAAPELPEGIGSYLTDKLEAVLSTQNSQNRKVIEENGEFEVFFEFIAPQVKLMVFGGGYDAVPLVDLAAQIGWDVTVTDDCIAHLAPSRFPNAKSTTECGRDLVAKKLDLDEYTACVLISHNYKYDLAVLRQLVNTNAFYIGILGPKKRHQKMLDQFELEGISFTAEQEERIFAPSGLNVGAETPMEIALSIVSEIQAVSKKHDSGFLREKSGPIHDRSKQKVQVDTLTQDVPTA